MISETLIGEIKRKCYITDDNEITNNRLKDIIKEAIPVVKRMIGLENVEFNFELEDNKEELKLLKNYCWYDWNDSIHEFKDNYLDDINSLHRKWEVKQYAEEES